MTALSKPRILFFDSGVGGLSVYQEVQKQLPDCHYLYCFDNAFFPYSEKSEALIIERVNKICTHLDRLYALDLIVIACNTASTIVLPSLRQHFSIPIVGTVPAIKPAAEYSSTKHIGLLATKGTVKREYIDHLIKKYAQSCRVEKIGSTKLVELAERKLRGYPVDLNEIRTELSEWIRMPDLDAIVLGCTHFPLIKSEIQQCLPQVSHFIDSGEAIAKRIAFLLNEVKVRSKNHMISQVFYTKPFIIEDDLSECLHALGFEQFSLIHINS